MASAKTLESSIGTIYRGSMVNGFILCTPGVLVYVRETEKPWENADILNT